MKLREVVKQHPLVLTKQKADHRDIADWLVSHDIKSYIIRPDGTVDVHGDVHLAHIRNLKILPIQFGKVTGNFFMSYNPQLYSLKGAPYRVGESFVCRNTIITSLVGCPQRVGGHFSCSETRITSLVGCPRHVGKHFWCITDGLASLSGIDKQIDFIGEGLFINPDVTNILGIIRIKKVGKVNVDYGGPIDHIMNKYLATHDAISAQDELIDAGFIEQAKL